MDEHYALTHLATVLAAAFIGGAVFQKLKQPVLVGYIIVGIILGPSVLGVVQGREEISLMAELGILLLLFIAGMELNLNNFKKVAKVSIVTCGVQIAAGLSAMLALGFLLGWPLNRSILLGFAVALSSTAVALKILDDTGLKPTHIGESSLGILIAQDIAVIPMILIIGALSTDEGFNYAGIIKMTVALLVMIGIVFLFTSRPKIFDKAWKKIDTFHDKLMQGQTAITSLAICFTASALAGLFGLSAAYGAFLAGLLIGNTMNHKKMEEHTKPIFDVMIMVFFLSIGLLIDLQFLQEHLLTTILLLFVTMLLKTIVNIAVLRWQGMEEKEAYVTGAVLAQIGEFSFILAAMGLAAHTIREDGYKYVVAIISLSLLVTPLWLYMVKHYDIISQLNLKQLRKRSPLQKFKTKKGNIMKIGILSCGPTLYSTMRLVEAAKERGHAVQVVNPLKCFMNINSVDNEIHYQDKILHLDAVVSRIAASVSFYGTAVVRQFEMSGVYALNGSLAITRSRDKLRAHQILSRRKLGMPITGFAHSTSNIDDLIEVAGGAPLVIKLLEGAQGKGVILTETKKAAESVIEAFRGLDAHFLIQEFIEEAGGEDIRCFVIGDKVVATMMRKSQDGDFRSNLHSGGKGEKVKITPEERKTAVSAAKAMGLDVAGVDLIRSKRGPLVLEVNSSPGLEGIEAVSKKDIAGLMIEHVEKNVHSTKKSRENKG